MKRYEDHERAKSASRLPPPRSLWIDPPPRSAVPLGMTDSAASEDYSHSEFPMPGAGATSPETPTYYGQSNGSYADIRDDLPDGAIMENGMKNQTTSADRFFGKSIIWGKDGEHRTAYMTRYWIGRLRLHIFHRGDQDPDAHDHPWDFLTFPLTSYVEEVSVKLHFDNQYGALFSEQRYATYRQIVPAFRLTFRPATHTHRVLGRWRGQRDSLGRPIVQPGKIITIVWRSEDKRKWGFLKNRDDKWCWVPWKEYVFGGGKSAPCE